MKKILISVEIPTGEFCIEGANGCSYLEYDHGREECLLHGDNLCARIKDDSDEWSPVKCKACLDAEQRFDKSIKGV